MGHVIIADFASSGMERHFYPFSVDWGHRRWARGTVDFATRPRTRHMEGRLKQDHHTFFATLAGGAREVEVTADSGHRYAGREKSGDVSYVPAGMTRHSQARDAAYEWISLTVSDSVFKGILAERGRTGIDLDAFTNQRDPLLFQLLLSLRRQIRTDGGLDACYAESVAFMAALHVLGPRLATAPATTGRHHLAPRRLERVVAFVDAHLDRPIHLQDLADVACLSAGHFHRAFRRQTGQTPHAYIEDRRIARARRLLAETTDTIGTIALALGYESQSHFAARFKQACGVTPSQYRRIRRF